MLCIKTLSLRDCCKNEQLQHSTRGIVIAFFKRLYIPSGNQRQFLTWTLSLRDHTNANTIILKINVVTGKFKNNKTKIC